MFWPDPTHQPTHPPNYTPTQGWESLHRFQIFKQNWNILNSSSAIEFWLIPGIHPPRGWGDGWMGVGGGERVPPIHMHMHVHSHICTYDIIGNSQGFPQWGLPFAIEIIIVNMYMCMRVHACACACMCTCVGGTPNHSHPHPPTPPHPRATGSPKHQNSITLELIEIIRFCLKILYLWTFLSSYRL